MESFDYFAPSLGALMRECTALLVVGSHRTVVCDRAWRETLLHDIHQANVPVLPRASSIGCGVLAAQVERNDLSIHEHAMHRQCRRLGIALPRNAVLTELHCGVREHPLQLLHARPLRVS